jgi:hypothetical protein
MKDRGAKTVVDFVDPSTIGKSAKVLVTIVAIIGGLIIGNLSGPDTKTTDRPYRDHWRGYLHGYLRGNDTVEPAYTVVFWRENAAKINWERVRTNNIPLIATKYWAAPSLRD